MDIQQHASLVMDIIDNADSHDEASTRIYDAIGVTLGELEDLSRRAYYHSDLKQFGTSEIACLLRKVELQREKEKA